MPHLLVQRLLQTCRTLAAASQPVASLELVEHLPVVRGSWNSTSGLTKQPPAQTMERQLASRSYASVVIGAGVRLLQQRLAIFEAAINAVHKTAPDAAIAAEPKANPPRRVAPRMSDFITCLTRESV